MTDRVGQQLGSYRLVRLLGRGGFAEVYLGQHQRLNMQAAIKVLHTQLADAADIQNFHREAQTIASLIHPHIVRVLDFDVKDGVPFLVMDYAPNGSLRRQHSKGVSLPLPTIVSYVKQVADALQYAHDQKLIHRDVKPENILLGWHNDVLLSDFGTATIALSGSSEYGGHHCLHGTRADSGPSPTSERPIRARHRRLRMALRRVSLSRLI
jgi:serine/threonine protein kinase